MNPEVAANLWDSAFDFRRVVLPFIREWLHPGIFIPVEAEAGPPALHVVDTVAGVDSWYVSGGTRLQGIASRVQYGREPYESFTIRSRLPSGSPTELAKRLEALQRHGEHFVVPHYTVQAWVERRRTGRLLLVLMVTTQDLFEFVVAFPEKVEQRRNPNDGSEFTVAWADDLRGAGYEVREGGEYDITIRLRGGRAWSPWTPDEEEEMEEVVGYWREEEDVPEDCIYPTDPGDFCPSCGDFHW